MKKLKLGFLLFSLLCGCMGVRRKPIYFRSENGLPVVPHSIEAENLFLSGSGTPVLFRSNPQPGELETVAVLEALTISLKLKEVSLAEFCVAVNSAVEKKYGKGQIRFHADVDKSWIGKEYVTVPEYDEYDVFPGYTEKWLDIRQPQFTVDVENMPLYRFLNEIELDLGCLRLIRFSLCNGTVTLHLVKRKEPLRYPVISVIIFPPEDVEQ